MSEEQLYVPDGDPCPTHGLPSQLQWIPGLGLRSQCRGCVEAFLEWYGQTHQGPPGSRINPLPQGVNLEVEPLRPVQLELGA